MIKRSLNSRFSEPVLSSRKVTTIRDKPWPVGKSIMLYNWSGKPYRSKHRDVAEIIVFSATSITIARMADGSMHYWPVRLPHPLWFCEGFESREDMDAWFSAKMKPGDQRAAYLMRFALAPLVAPAAPAVKCAGAPRWNLADRVETAMSEAKAAYVPPTGTKIEQAREIIRRCEALDIKLRDQAIEAENAGDHEACWLNMATRAQNTRFLERVRADLLNLQNAQARP